MSLMVSLFIVSICLHLADDGIKVFHELKQKYLKHLFFYKIRWLLEISKKSCEISKQINSNLLDAWKVHFIVTGKLRWKIKSNKD